MWSGGFDVCYDSHQRTLRFPARWRSVSKRERTLQSLAICSLMDWYEAKTKREFD